MVKNIYNQKKLTITLKLQMNYLKMVTHINVIVQVQKLKIKKKEQDKKKFLIFMTESGEIRRKQMHQKI